MKEPKLAVFSRFKAGKKEITGEAKRQRSIIMTLAANMTNPADRTRTGIAQHMAKAEDTLWKNIYSGIFRDLDEVLLPMHIVQEEGRLPLKRGPKALQEIGVPYYRLTREGILVAAALADAKGERTRLLEIFLQKTHRNKRQDLQIYLAHYQRPVQLLYLTSYRCM